MSPNRMKLSQDYILRTVAGEAMVIPVGEAALKNRGLFRLSESGRLLFERLQTGADRETLVQLLRDSYEIEDDTQVQADVDQFLRQLELSGMLMEA